MLTINCKGRLINWEQPIVMGIINATPDSFHTDSRVTTIEAAIQKAAEMIRLGASVLDIGGQSTRPNSEKLSPAEEANRVLPIIQALIQKFPDTLISIDTYYASVARLAVDAGASIVNDVSAGLADEEMLATVALLKTPYICMHHGGDGQNLHQTLHATDTNQAVFDFFIERIAACNEVGIKDIIIDPGFGFGKTIEANFQLIKGIAILKQLGKPILLGVSRKSSIYKSLGITADEALNGTTVVNTAGLLQGADILRVHDVTEAMEAIKLVNLMK